MDGIEDNESYSLLPKDTKSLKELRVKKRLMELGENTALWKYAIEVNTDVYLPLQKSDKSGFQKCELLCL